MMGSWGLDSWVYECLVPLGVPGGRLLTGKTALPALDMFALGSRGRVPPLPPSPRTRPGLTSAVPGLPPARLPTASCARRTSSNSGSNSGSGGGPRRRPRPRVAGLACPMSGPSRPHVPCTPALLGRAPAVTGAPSATTAASSSLRPRAALAPPAPPHASPAFLARTIAWQLCAEQSSSETLGGSLRQAPAPLRFQVSHPMLGLSLESRSQSPRLWICDLP